MLVLIEFGQQIFILLEIKIVLTSSIMSLIKGVNYSDIILTSFERTKKRECTAMHIPLFLLPLSLRNYSRNSD